MTPIANKFRLRAEGCAEIAARTDADDLKSTMLAMAQNWETLARSSEEHERQYRDPVQRFSSKSTHYRDRPGTSVLHARRSLQPRGTPTADHPGRSQPDIPGTEPAIRPIAADQRRIRIKSGSSTFRIDRNHDLAGLELLRFICAFAIVVLHYQNFLFSGEFSEAVAAPQRSTLPIYALLSPAYEYGYCAVQVFWLISGFIFYRQYAEFVHSGRVGLYDFVIRRFSRLYPLHFVTLLLVALGQNVYTLSHSEAFIFSDISGISFTHQLFLASSWLPWRFDSFNGPIWSISVEILIYFAFFAIARTLGPKPMVALSAATVCWLLYKSHLTDSFLNSRVLACGVFFFAGGVAQTLCKHRLAPMLAGYMGVAILGLLALHILEFNFKVTLALAAFAVIFFSRLDETRVGPIVQRLGFLGNATYASYLIQFPLQLGIVIALDALHLNRAVLLHPVAFLVYLAAVMAISFAVYRSFERPAQEWIRNGSKRLIKSATRPRRVRVQLR